MRLACPPRSANDISGRRPGNRGILDPPLLSQLIPIRSPPLLTLSFLFIAPLIPLNVVRLKYFVLCLTWFVKNIISLLLNNYKCCISGHSWKKDQMGFGSGTHVNPDRYTTEGNREATKTEQDVTRHVMRAWMKDDQPVSGWAYDPRTGTQR